MKKQNNFAENIKALPLWDKVFYISNLAVILGFLLPFFSMIDGMFLNMPYAWLLFLVALSLPAIKIFMDKSQLKRDLLFGLSELLAVVSIFGLVILSKLMNSIGGFTYNAVGLFDIIGIGAFFLIVGSIVLFISVLMKRE